MFLTNKPNDGKFGALCIFNQDEVSAATGVRLEFAECQECGQIYHPGREKKYPDRCMRCGAEFVSKKVIR